MSCVPLQAEPLDVATPHRVAKPSKLVLEDALPTSKIGALTTRTARLVRQLFISPDNT